jgi:putative ABC transport system permease protein
MKIRDTFLLAWRTITSNKLRTGLTVAIIAFGIMALVGINTAIEAMKQKFTESFSSMGANGFTIRFQDSRNFRGNGEVKKEKRGEKKQKVSNTNKPITKNQAESFKNMFAFPSKVGISLFGVRDAIANVKDKKTNPNVYVFGIDENYLELNGFNISGGRTLNSLDIQSGRNVAILGRDIAVKLFGDLEKPVDKIIKINNVPYRIIGTLEAKGSTLGRSQDNVIFTSYNNVRRFFNSNANASFSIQVKINDIQFLDVATGQAEGTFRAIRKLNTTEEDNFLIDRSDAFVELLLNNLRYLTGAAVLIGMITLVGAAVGLMNIMLVAVTERTKEIGLIKAVGGKQKNVRRQFLYESMLISLLGASFGIVLGIIVGNSFSLVLNTGFVIPWQWLIWGIAICSVVGLLAGVYPAFKASKLNPIEALRYE